MKKKIFVLDSTLRDGMQAEGISYTLEDKLLILNKLKKLTIDYVEAGNPFSNPKDREFLLEAAELDLDNTKLVAFGSTRRKDVKPEDDLGLKALLECKASVCSIVGKASEKQVKDVLETDLDTNIKMIYDSIKFLKKHNLTVFFDAEHFFDGYKKNGEYSLSCIEAAQNAGADYIVLCDTNGGTLPDEIAKIVEEVVSVTSVPIGIHCHNDNGCAVAGSILAVKAGATQVQGTFLGFGERCGNANLSTIIPTLQLKNDYQLIDNDKMLRLTKTARFIAEISNINLEKTLPYVGDSAFSHKGGMHVDGVKKVSSAFEHIDPKIVGNNRHILMSEVGGKAAMLSLINEIDKTITKDSPEAKTLLKRLKDLEFNGYVFESAPASLELLIKKELHRYEPSFVLKRFKVIGEQTKTGQNGVSSAIIKIKVGGETEITASEGEGPVHALDTALKKAVTRFFPKIERLRLVDYKVRVMEPKDATAAVVRVLITTYNGKENYTTIGVSRDIIEASLNALVDAIEYDLSQSK